MSCFIKVRKYVHGPDNLIFTVVVTETLPTAPPSAPREEERVMAEKVLLGVTTVVRGGGGKAPSSSTNACVNRGDNELENH